MATQPTKCTPLGKPVRKTHEAEPLTVPDTFPSTAPAEPQPQKEPVPA